ALLLEPAWTPALLQLACVRLQLRRAAATLPVRRVCWQPLRLAREPFPRGRAPLPTRGPGDLLSPQRLSERLLPWRVAGPQLPRVCGPLLAQRSCELPLQRASRLLPRGSEPLPIGGPGVPLSPRQLGGPPLP